MPSIQKASELNFNLNSGEELKLSKDGKYVVLIWGVIFVKLWKKKQIY